MYHLLVWLYIIANITTPNSPQKQYKADHQGAFIHQAGGGSTLSDMEVRIVVGVDTPLKMLPLYMNKCKV